MLTIGLTGGIASGKNFVAEILKKKRIPVFDADFEVHKLLATDQDLINKIIKIFPRALDNKGCIDRSALRQMVTKDPSNIKILEDFIHPKIRDLEVKFLKLARYQKKAVVALNIPLLLENEALKPILTIKSKKITALSKNISVKYKSSCSKNGARSARRFDFIVSVVTSRNIQRQRFLARDPEKGKDFFDQAIKRQVSNLQRRKFSDFIIQNNSSKFNVLRQISRILLKITQ